jgi:hypothetical protein
MRIQTHIFMECKLLLLSSLARTLRSGIRIPLKTWKSVYAFILCLCCPGDGHITRPRGPTACVKSDYGTEKEARGPVRTTEKKILLRQNYIVTFKGLLHDL